MEMMMFVKARWDLDLTTKDARDSAVTEFLHTTTSNDVQPLPLAVCEAFGGVLGICGGTTAAVATRLFQELPHEALLRFAMPEILPKMTCGKFGRLGQNSGLVGNYSVSDPLEFNHPTALPDISKVKEICNMITGSETRQKFTICQDVKLGIRFMAKRQMELLEKECRCADCRGRDGNFTSESETCPVQEFYLKFSAILVDILALSLFETPKSLLVRPSRDRHNAEQLKHTVCDVLRNGEPRVFDDGRGQVVYPSVYGSHGIERVGYLRLSNFCGVLKYEGDVYNVVASQDIDVSGVTDELEQNIYENNQNPEILQPMNLYRKIRVSWEAYTQDHGEIQANLLIHTKDCTFIAARSLSLLITALKDTIFYEDCLQGSRSRLEKADRFATNQPPWSSVVAENDENSRVNIIAVDAQQLY
ncbi:hypothetical protein V8C34DRAFT_301412 [Trichoderma compactum]